MNNTNNDDNHLGKVLIVDDDKDILVAARLLLKRNFGKVDTSNDPQLLPKLLQEEDYDVVLLDMNFTTGETSGQEGLYWLNRIHELFPETVVILITGYSTVNTAVEGMKQGASDFVAKPWQNEKLVATVQAAMELQRSRRETNRLKQEKRELVMRINQTNQPILGKSKAMQQVLKVVERAAPTDANVLILGENGTGKELVAREIHAHSQRVNEPFISVDLGAITETLFESQLFGHKRGAFTDAREDRVGQFEMANGGTLFLDELGNLPLHLQPKLLTALEQRQVLPIGASKPVDIDVRVICATNMPLQDLSNDDVFRQDLRYRLNTIEIHLPALRDRPGDIALLINEFVAQYARKYARDIQSVSQEALKSLSNYRWPGNVRALRHAVERAVIMSEGNTLEMDDFTLSEIYQEEGGGTAGKPTELLTLHDIESRAIANALRKNRGNVTETAKELGLTRASLYRRMEKYEL